MNLITIVETIDHHTKAERLKAGEHAQKFVKDELRQHFGKEISKIKLARVGSKLFDIEALIHNVSQKVEVKSLSDQKPFFAFFDTFVQPESHAPDLDEIAFRATHGKYQYFCDAVKHEPDGGFPCDTSGRKIPKSGRVPALLKHITDRPTLDWIRMKVIRDLQDKGINYLAIFNRTSNKVTYYHTHNENYLNAPQMPHLRMVYMDTYGAPEDCAMRVVVRMSF